MKIRIIRILFAFLHQFDKSPEKIFGIVRSGRGFGMILHRKNRQSFMTQTRNRVVVQVNVRYLDFRRQAFGFDRKAVIMRGDFDFSGRQILDRLVAAAMSEF